MSTRNVQPRKVELLNTIDRVVNALVNITDSTGEFLMPLADGRIIDTKGWEDWEVRTLSNLLEFIPRAERTLPSGPMVSACTVFFTSTSSQSRRRR
jgi:hypothetical protein